MQLRKLLVVPAALVMGAMTALTAGADTLVLRDGRRIQGELISANRTTLVFQESRGSGRTMRVPRSDVMRVVFRDNVVSDDDTYDSNDSYSNDPYRNDPYSDNTYGNDTYGSDSRFDQRRNVTVSATRQWTDTGLNVRAGQEIRFLSSGMVNWGPGRQDGPEGEMNSPSNSRRPIPNRAGAALIGRLGNDVFFIGGDQGVFRARTSGRLYLGINDDHLQDNSGSFRVMVEY
jgi:hypothetical protein